MLEIYKKVLTKKGMQLHAKNLAGEKVEFTKFQFGSGTYAGDESEAYLEAMVALKTPKDSFGISKVELADKNNNATCLLTLAATNINVTSGYYITEIGEFAKGADGVEVLYSIAVAKPDKPEWMPAYNSKTPVSIKYLDYISVGNASNVTLSVGAGGVALQEDLEAVETRVLNLERGSAGCVGIRRKCTADGTPQSSTTWERWGQATGAVVEFARGDDAVQNTLMSKWPYNLLKPCNLPLDADEPVAYLGDADFDWYGATGAAAGTSVMLEVPTEMYLAHWFEKDSTGQNWEYKVVADTGRYPNSVYVKDLMKRGDGSTRNAFYFPIFLGSYNSAGNYVSVAGAVPQYSTSCITLRTKAKANGDNWQLIDVWAWEIMTYLAEIMGGSADSRNSFGRGCSEFGSAVDMVALVASDSTNTITVSSNFQSRLRVGMIVNIGAAQWGTTVAKNRKITAITASEAADSAIDVTLDGDAFSVAVGNILWRGAQTTGATINMVSPNGTAGANDGTHSVRVLYIEDFYGMLHTGVDGLNLKFNEEKMGLEIYVCTNPSKYADTYTDYELLDGLLELNGENAPNFDNGGYIKKEYFYEKYPLLEMTEVTTGAGSTTYEAAYCWKNKNGQRPFFGGAFYGGAYVSPRSRNCSCGFSNAGVSYGSRPLRR